MRVLIQRFVRQLQNETAIDADGVDVLTPLDLTHTIFVTVEGAGTTTLGISSSYAGHVTNTFMTAPLFPRDLRNSSSTNSSNRPIVQSLVVNSVAA